MNFFRRFFGSRPKTKPRAQKKVTTSEPLAPELMRGFDALADNLRAQKVQNDRYHREMVEHYKEQTERERQRSPSSPTSSATHSPATPAPTTSSGPSSMPPPPQQVRYRGLTFGIDGEYSLVCDDKKIVRGIWYRDRSSIQIATRNRMIAANARVNGFTVLDSDYEITIVGGVGGVEDLQNPGGAILWFDSARELFGK